MAVIDLRDGMDPVRILTRQLIEAADRPDAEKPYGVYFVGSASRFSPLARTVEREVFAEVFGNDDHTMDREYGPFEDASDFVIVVDHSIEEPSGALRMIRPNPNGLKTLIDVELEPRWGRSHSDFIAFHEPSRGMEGVHDVATIAVRGGWTNASPDLKTSHALYAGLYWWSITNDVELLVSAIDESVAGLLEALSIPLEPLCGLPALEYLGSAATRPYVIWVSETLRRMRVDPQIRSLLVGELVLSDFSFPPIDLDAPDINLQGELGEVVQTELPSLR